MSALIVGCLACPPAHADGGYGPGSYAVPAQLPYGTYVAHAEPGDYSAACCTYTTWTSDGKLIVSDSGNTVAATVTAPAVAKFIIHGCTAWRKAG
ncbi:hypothetical protein ACKUT9_09070 [Mycobacterium seoulense]|uniref:Uncharacterized protein n=1 Tax=Mycobacterium seoulense TaxID=386911 RepID=A0A7I7NW35_9MYCO|nr:hypothetical protein [Mycobacterium seoulense]MCV7439820.1 hypothetical protein [Mycobacterium seoulense]BBX99747.1 hypothetical protein MSEO_02470 [Mycobacterium seoulense]